MPNNSNRKLNWNLQSFGYSMLSTNDLGQEHGINGEEACWVEHTRLVYSMLDW